MLFTFFDMADRVLFVREDAESAIWTHEQLSLTLLFPYDAGKVISRGMRVGFTDALGVFQVFEIRKVRSYQPDHYQEITAEHIVIAELTNEHFAGHDYTSATAQTVLAALLSGTLWSVGTVTASGSSGADLGVTSVWESIRTVEENWNVYITPRVVVSDTGITGRYLDIAPAGGTWRGIRLAVDKNADELGVTVDDSETVTALFGYGRSTGTAGSKPKPLTFKDVVWSETASHPAKPAGQLYIEDPEATALYGRNGRPRFGFYQNGEIDNANTLLQKTWEVLKTCNAPTVSVDCLVADLFRLGYADQPLRLHDTALAEILPEGTTVQLEIISLSEDLLDPTATRVQMGKYIPNIIYIARETSRHASGGGGGGISGRRGGGGSGGQTNREKEISEFQTQIAVNQYEISLTAKQVDLDNVNETLREAGIYITAGGVWAFATDRTTGLGSTLGVQADKISVVVSDAGQIKVASIVAAVNDSGSSVMINADKIILDGQTLVSQLESTNASITNLTTGVTTATALRATTMYAQTVEVGSVLRVTSNASISYQGSTMAWKTRTIVTSVSVTLPTVTRSNEHRFLYSDTGLTPEGSVNGRIITGYSSGSVSVNTDTLSYVGKA